MTSGPTLKAPSSVGVLSRAIAAPASQPAAIAPHFPLIPAPFFEARHELQPAQAESQQTPSTQNPDPHWVPDVHANPG